MESAVLLLAGFLGWTISSLSGGGGSLLFVAAISHVAGVRSVAPVAALASLVASLSRLGLFWKNIDWQVVRWYLPGAMAGSAAGAWAFTQINAGLLQIVIAVFLVSTVWQFRLGRAAQSFPMRLPWFIPVSIVSGFTSGLSGASGLLVNPFYLNYGLLREPLLATRAANSLFIQITKLATYGYLGVLTADSLRSGMIAGAGALASISLSKAWLPLLSNTRFRQIAVFVMLASGGYILWQQRPMLLVLLAPM